MGWYRKWPDKQLIGCTCTGWRMSCSESCFLENYVSTNDWQCPYIRGRCSYVCHTKRGRKTHALWGIGTRECLMLYLSCCTNRGHYKRVQLYLELYACTPTSAPEKQVLFQMTWGTYVAWCCSYMPLVVRSVTPIEKGWCVSLLVKESVTAMPYECCTQFHAVSQFSIHLHTPARGPWAERLYSQR
jgi:hypothetical protein